ncbi:MAG: HD-GYP domain-containing protein [Nitrospirae bacterium]|nr:HD-GYP domain-containing protein [Nitrospirota bacterium]
MIKKIKVDQLKPGIFIHDINCDWLDHPFISNKIKIKNERDIDKIVTHGINEVYIDTDKGMDVVDAPTKKDVEIQGELDKLTDTKLKTGSRALLKEELVRAREIIKESKKAIYNIMEDVKLGKQIEIKQVENIVEKIADSIFQNKDALMSLGRIKQKDEYTYMHSLSVCALLISFAEQLDLDYKTIKAVGIGGLLHDIGKVKVPIEILNKKGPLSEKEFTIMKEHVKLGCNIIEQCTSIDEISFYVTAHHHERLSGTGYPYSLKGDEISIFGQMSAVADVYDALSSDRCYKDKIIPTEALRKLYEWSNSYYNKNLVEQFICCVGIYPVGTLVRLESGLLGIVVDHGVKGLLYPLIRIIYDTIKGVFVVPYDKDISELSDKGIKDTVINYESPERWNIKPEMYL